MKRVKGHTDLVRTKTGSINVDNSEAIRVAKLKKRKREEERKYVSSLENRILDLEKRINTIEQEMSKANDGS